MFLDSSLLSSDAIGDNEGVDTVAGGGNGDVVGFKDDPDNDNDADDDEDDQKEDDDDWEGNDAAAKATDVVNVVIDKDGNGDDGTGVDCTSVPVCGCKIVTLLNITITWNGDSNGVY